MQVWRLKLKESIVHHNKTLSGFRARPKNHEAESIEVTCITLVAMFMSNWREARRHQSVRRGLGVFLQGPILELLNIHRF